VIRVGKKIVKVIQEAEEKWEGQTDVPEDGEDDVRELKVKRWRQNAVIEKTVVKEAKVL
jgi:hypothetical protein